MKQLVLITLSTLLLSCVNQKDLALQYKILDEVHLERNTYYLQEERDKLFFKLNTGSQDILFIVKASTDQKIETYDMKKARCFAVHYNGAVCDEGNFKVTEGYIKLNARDDGLRVSLKTVSLKIDGGLKTKSDLRKLLRSSSDYECKWSWSAPMRASLHPTR